MEDKAYNEDSMMSGRYKKRRSLGFWTRYLSLSSPVFIKRKVKKDFLLLNTMYLILLFILCGVLWGVGFFYQKEIHYPKVELYHKGDVLADLKGLRVTSLNLHHFNPGLPTGALSVPLAEYITLDQTLGDCLDLTLPCDKDSDCDDLPEIFISPKSTGASCQEYQGGKYCVVHDWCPQQDPRRPHTNWILYDNALEVKIFAFCDECRVLDTHMGKSSSLEKVRQFPAKGANVFRVKELIKASGMSYDQVQSIGGSINLYRNHSCVSIFGFYSCSDSLHVYPLEYYGESLGYSAITTNNLRSFKNTRNRHQIISLNISYQLRFETLHFSVLRLFLFFCFLYLINASYNSCVINASISK